jgi:chaperonin GroEL (HSP60 family)
VRRREKVLRGATQLADAVRITLGPKSKSVLIQKSWGAPLVCNDGVTIAKEIQLKDPEENLGAQMLRQAAERTAEVVGDGTSGSTILAHALLADGVRNVDRRRQRHRHQARPRSRVPGGRRRTEGDVAPRDDPEGEGAGRHHLRPQ